MYREDRGYIDIKFFYKHCKQSPANTTGRLSTYKVQSGDGLIGLANRFGMSVETLAKPITATNAQLLKGQTLTSLQRLPTKCNLAIA